MRSSDRKLFRENGCRYEMNLVIVSSEECEWPEEEATEHPVLAVCMVSSSGTVNCTILATCRHSNSTNIESTLPPPPCIVSDDVIITTHTHTYRVVLR